MFGEVLKIAKAATLVDFARTKYKQKISSNFVYETKLKVIALKSKDIMKYQDG